MEVRAASRKLSDALSRHRIYRDISEIGLVALAFLLYFIVRGSVVDRDDEALRNNRLALLAELRAMFLNVADVSRLSTG